MTDDFLGQLVLDPHAPETWKPLLQHAAEEMAAGILEIAPRHPAAAQSMISMFVFEMLDSCVKSAEVASGAIGEGRALDALLAENPSCRKTFGDFDVFRATLIEAERHQALERLLKKITNSALVQ